MIKIPESCQRTEERRSFLASCVALAIASFPVEVVASRSAHASSEPEVDKVEDLMTRLKGVLPTSWRELKDSGVADDTTVATYGNAGPSHTLEFRVANADVLAVIGKSIMQRTEKTSKSGITDGESIYISNANGDHRLRWHYVRQAKVKGELYILDLSTSVDLVSDEDAREGTDFYDGFIERCNQGRLEMFGAMMEFAEWVGERNSKGRKKPSSNDKLSLVPIWLDVKEGKKIDLKRASEQEFIYVLNTSSKDAEIVAELIKDLQKLGWKPEEKEISEIQASNSAKFTFFEKEKANYVHVYKVATFKNNSKTSTIWYARFRNDRKRPSDLVVNGRTSVEFAGVHFKKAAEQIFGE